MPETPHWTSHSVTVEYQDKPAPQLIANVHVTVRAGDTTHTYSSIHRLQVTGPTEAVLSRHDLYSTDLPYETPLAPYPEYANRQPVEPCTLLSLYRSQLHQAIEDSLHDALHMATSTYIAQAHNAHRK